MPKVLRIINRFNLGGPAYNVAYLSKYLSPEYETLLIGGDKEPDEESSLFIFKEMGLEPLVLSEMDRSVNFFNDIKAYYRIKKIIKEFKPDIVHTHAAKAGALGRLAAYNCKVPVIVHTFHGHVFHSYFGKIKTNIYKWVERYLAKRSSAIIAISEKQKQELCEEHKIADAEKVKVIPLGFDLSRFTENQEAKRKIFREEYRVRENEICIIIIGRLVPVKNHGLFLNAIANLKKNSSKKIRAFIVGDGDLRQELYAQAKNLGLDHCYWPEEQKNATLTFTSWINDVSFPLAGSDVVCLTSFNEGTPVSLIEAQAASKAIVTTKTGGIENSVCKEAAFLVAVNDERSFSKNLLLLVENNVLRAQMAEKGKAFVLAHFHYTRLVEDVRGLYHKLRD
jgi:glycosyltransferase involved in cell wall biosynthesis